MKHKVVFENEKFYVHKVLFTVFGFQVSRPVTDGSGDPVLFTDLKTAIGFASIQS